jgi:hypothetical protein
MVVVTRESDWFWTDGLEFLVTYPFVFFTSLHSFIMILNAGFILILILILSLFFFFFLTMLRLGIASREELVRC